MVSPAVIAGTYDGEALQQVNGEGDLVLYLVPTQGLNDPPEVRGEDWTVPGLDGQQPRPRRPHERRIVLSGFVRGKQADTATSQAFYRARVRYLNDLYDTARLPADLVLELEDGSTATISARPLNMIFNERVVSEWADLTVELVSTDPNWTYEEAS